MEMHEVDGIIESPMGQVGKEVITVRSVASIYSSPAQAAVGASIDIQPNRLVVLLAACFPMLESIVNKSALEMLSGLVPLSAKRRKVLLHIPGGGGYPFFPRSITGGPKSNDSSIMHFFSNSITHVLRVFVL